MTRGCAQRRGCRRCVGHEQVVSGGGAGGGGGGGGGGSEAVVVARRWWLRTAKGPCTSSAKKRTMHVVRMRCRGIRLQARVEGLRESAAFCVRRCPAYHSAADEWDTGRLLNASRRRYACLWVCVSGVQTHTPTHARAHADMHTCTHMHSNAQREHPYILPHTHARTHIRTHNTHIRTRLRRPDQFTFSLSLLSCHFERPPSRRLRV